MTESILKIKETFFNEDRIKDYVLSVFVMSIAGCGMIYQYLLASYSGRVIGSMEITIFTIMTLMIVSMGAGSFIVHKFKNQFFSFSILESSIAFIIFATVYIISGTNALSFALPELVADTFGFPVGTVPEGGFISKAEDLLQSSSYVMACFMGFLIGMEIPFLAAIREQIHEGKKLKNNIGVIYGVDYIGAGIGAFIWIFILIKFEIADALKYVAYVNVLVGFFFILAFKKHIKKVKTAMFVQFATALFIFFAADGISSWQKTLEQSLYRDKVVYSHNTKFQHFTITKGLNSVNKEEIFSLFINGRTQFSSSDEGIYHSLLTAPTLIAAGMPDKVLVIGGGDGLAARDILRTDVKDVLLMDLDSELIDFFKKPVFDDTGSQINLDFIRMNENAFNDKRMRFLFGDAYLNIKELVRRGEKFGAIIVDLPDPSHPDLNKLYSKSFYKLLNGLLENTGAISIQSSSPHLSKDAFISIGKTLHASGFITQQYQHIVPSFGGQWGWTIGTKAKPAAKARIAMNSELPIDDEWLTRGKLLSTFEFGKNYYKTLEDIKVNTIDNNATYLYYNQGWREMTNSVFE